MRFNLMKDKDLPVEVVHFGMVHVRHSFIHILSTTLVLLSGQQLLIRTVVEGALEKLTANLRLCSWHPQSHWSTKFKNFFFLNGAKWVSATTKSNWWSYSVA
jgi:hypothetical protein